MALVDGVLTDTTQRRITNRIKVLGAVEVLSRAGPLRVITAIHAPGTPHRNRYVAELECGHFRTLSMSNNEQLQTQDRVRCPQC
jgi:hypothetical protein